jgi:hypothetical protein
MTKNQLEELMIRTTQVSELKSILSQVIPDETSPIFSEGGQKMVLMLTQEEHMIIKKRMIDLIDKYFI